MADQGAIGTSKLQHTIASLVTAKYKSLFYTKTGGIAHTGLTSNTGNITSPPGLYYLAGVVTESSVFLANITVRLYRRSGGQLVDSQTTTAEGFYIFRKLKLEASNYFIVAFDNLNISPNYNAVIADLLTPVA